MLKEILEKILWRKKTTMEIVEIEELILPQEEGKIGNEASVVPKEEVQTTNTKWVISESDEV
jgi:hypothetical protein